MKLSELQTAIVEKIQSLDGFAQVKVLSEIKGDLASEVEQAMAKVGLAVIVLTPSALNEQPDVAAGNVLVNVTVQVSESPLINRSAGGVDLPAIDAATTIAGKLHWSSTPGYTLLKFQSIELIEDTPQLVYHATFTTHTRL